MTIPPVIATGDDEQSEDQGATTGVVHTGELRRIPIRYSLESYPLRMITRSDRGEARFDGRALTEIPSTTSTFNTVTGICQGMYLTRRGWTVGALATVLAVLAVVFARPIVLAGSAFLGAWLLAHQYRFTRDIERTVDSLSVVQSPARTTIRTGDEMPVTLTARRARPRRPSRSRLLPGSRSAPRRPNRSP